MKVGPGAHACDVSEDLALADHLAGPETWPRPDMPVLGEHHAGRGLVADEDAALEGWIHDIADDHAVGGRLDRLDPGADVDAGMQPDRPRRRAAAQHGSVAQAPLAAKAEAVRLPGGERELKRVGTLSG